jgi:peptidoglycan/LPS O-acetylase OafA/YrhL
VSEPRRDWFPSLDAVRALGATAVVGTHVAFYTGRITHGPLSGALARLDIGVALFFVLTGFLLFRPYAVAALTGGARPSTGSYLRRRALRILPAYWVVVVVCVGLLAPLGATHGWAELLRHLTLTQIYGLGIQHTGLTQTWSLAVEVSFYLLLPLLARLVLRGRGVRLTYVSLAGLAVAGAAWSPVLNSTGILDIRMAGQWLPAFLDWFVAGMLLALVQVHLTLARPPALVALEDVAASLGTCWAAAAAVFAIAASPLAGPTTITGGGLAPTGVDIALKNALYLLVAVLVVLPLVLGPQVGGPVRRALGSRPLRLLGEISYGIFLYHLAVLEAVVHLRHQPLFTGGWLLTFALTMAVTVPLAWTSYRFMERPLMSRRRRSVTVAHPRHEASVVSAAQISASAITQSV